MPELAGSLARNVEASPERKALMAWTSLIAAGRMIITLSSAMSGYDSLNQWIPKIGT